MIFVERSLLHQCAAGIFLPAAAKNS